MKNALRQIAHGLACQFGKDCEIVVHDLDSEHLENTIAIIENGHVSNRKQGDGPSPVVLEALKRAPAAPEDQLAYLMKTHDGRILKSSTLYIRDENGKIAAVFSINYDITSLLAIEGSIHSLIATDNNEENISQVMPSSVNDLLDQLIEQSIRLVGKPVPMMTKDDKIRAIQYLNNTGAFLITRSGDKVTKKFGISKYTLYSYIDASKGE